MDPALIVGPLSSIAGVGLGAFLGWRISLSTRQDERKWLEQQAVRDRQERAADTLDQAILALSKETPQMVLEGEAAKGLLRKAHVKLHEAWARSTVLNVPEIDERMNALNIALVIAEQDASFGEQDVNYWPLSIALRDVRKALAAFQRREPLPVKEFPPVDEVIALAHPKGRNVGLDGVRQELMNRAVL